jgi:hypothetical protein
MMNAVSELEQLSASLQTLRDSNGPASPFVLQARQYTTLLDALPEKYRLVYHDILDRLESGALFSEESCSFSQRDLLDNLDVWIAKAQGQLAQSA